MFRLKGRWKSRRLFSGCKLSFSSILKKKKKLLRSMTWTVNETNVQIINFRLLKMYKKIHKFMTVLNYFTTHEWKFSTDRVRGMLNKLSFQDRDIFFFDIQDLVWDTYFQTYIQGIRIYLIKDPLDTLPQAIVRWQRLVTVINHYRLFIFYYWYTF